MRYFADWATTKHCQRALVYHFDVCLLIFDFYLFVDLLICVYLWYRRVCRVLSTSEEEGTEPAQPGPSSPQPQPKVKKESKKTKKPTKKKKVSCFSFAILSVCEVNPVQFHVANQDHPKRE